MNKARVAYLMCSFLVAQCSPVICSRIPEQSALFVDLGGVVFIGDIAGIVKHTGVSPFAYFIGHGITQFDPDVFKQVSTKIRNRILYPFLEKLIPYTKDELPVYDEHACRLPQPIVEWLAGRKSGAALQAYVQEAVALKSSWFEHEWEKDIVVAITSMMFTPEKFVDGTKILPTTVAFIQECARKGHPVYILSNWDPASFALLQQRYPEFFDFISGVVLSGMCGYCKPHRQIYDYILATYNLQPDNCFFIDDILANIHAAQEVGIHAALCKNNDIETIKADYQAWMTE